MSYTFTSPFKMQLKKAYKEKFQYRFNLNDILIFLNNLMHLKSFGKVETNAKKLDWLKNWT